MDIKSDADVQIKLLRIMLGLNPVHDPLELIRVLYEDGREAFEKLRGDRCDFAHEWEPRLYDYGSFVVRSVESRPSKDEVLAAIVSGITNKNRHAEM